MQGAPPWGTFLASLQASQTPQKPSSKDIVESWAGTVFWNNTWEKSLHSEAEEAQQKKQAALDAAQASSSDGPEATAAPATGAALTNTCALFKCHQHSSFKQSRSQTLPHCLQAKLRVSA